MDTLTSVCVTVKLAAAVIIFVKLLVLPLSAYEVTKVVVAPSVLTSSTLGETMTPPPMTAAIALAVAVLFRAVAAAETLLLRFPVTVTVRRYGCVPFVCKSRRPELELVPVLVVLVLGGTGWPQEMGEIAGARPGKEETTALTMRER